MDGSEKPEDRIVRLMKDAAPKPSGVSPEGDGREPKPIPPNAPGTNNFITSGDLHISIGSVVYLCRTP